MQTAQPKPITTKRLFTVCTCVCVVFLQALSVRVRVRVPVTVGWPSNLRATPAQCAVWPS